ncbi:ATP-dependent DNA helicase recQ [Cesiribacter andamanensis AMV16]|uniref:DNA helicase RecQ n=2 Tax=Cesiribacter TaxID=1133570 RepID=M7N6B1_9BACT|nr:ATP-dependent DNA helicase recQ [Cesiribacter andamanensis AMV16]
MQAEVVTAVGNRQDVLVLMPTGGGKSLCYQVPALHLPGIAVVISPLIALMQDQISALKASGIAAGCLNSAQSWQEQVEVERQAAGGQLKLLYVSPEKLQTPAFMALLRQLQISLFAIDEAHCISFWGHDFRPEYTQLSLLKQQFPQVPIIALTATADKLTRTDILQQLRLQNPQVFVASFDRPNLSLTVLPAQQRMQRIVEFLEARPFQPGIIYCLSRKACEALAQKLQDAGYRAEAYHAALPHQQRQRTQEAFLRDDVQIVCATIAFGMGIDKSNVRWVLHYNLPKNIESYSQEIGRAGRDGAPADTLLFYSFADVMKQRSMLEALPDERRRLQEAKLERLQQYAEAQICRRRILLAYFGEQAGADCQNCDVCQNPRQSLEGTRYAQMALSAIARSGEALSLPLLIDVLRGADNEEVRQKGLFRIKTYGAGREVSAADWRNFLQQLLNTGLVDIAYDQGGKLKLNDSSRAVLFEGQPVVLYKAAQPPQLVKPQPKQAERVDEALFLQLRNLRKRLADEEALPPYIIFSDKTLREMAEKQPISEASMLRIGGISRPKMERYGQDFINEILSYRQQQGSGHPGFGHPGSGQPRSGHPGASHLVTLSLLQQGLRPEAIAERRNLQLETVYSHLAALYEQGQLPSLDHYLSKQEREAMADAFYVHGVNSPLQPLYESLKGKYPHHKLRLAASYFRKQGLRT